jgi:hypothetical protein
MWLHVIFNGAITAYSLLRHTELSNSKVALHCIQNSKPLSKKERKSSSSGLRLQFSEVRGGSCFTGPRSVEIGTRPIHEVELFKLLIEDSFFNLFIRTYK